MLLYIPTFLDWAFWADQSSFTLSSKHLLEDRILQEMPMKDLYIAYIQHLIAAPEISPGDWWTTLDGDRQEVVWMIKYVVYLMQKQNQHGNMEWF